MKNLTWVAIALMSATPCFAQSSSIQDYADVVSVRERVERVSRPVERCWNEVVERPAAQKSPLGAVLGAAGGGVVAHQFGQGRGKDWLTAGGVVAGALLGDRIADNEARGSREDVRRCRTEDRWIETVTGYEVTYIYAGQQMTTFTERDPGRRLPVTVTVQPSGGRY